MTASKQDINLTIEPILVSDERAATMLGLGVTYYRRLVANGRVAPRPVVLGKRRLHSVTLLRRWAELGCPSADSPVWKAAK